MDKPLWMWAVFLGIVLTLLVLDLGVFQRRQRVIEVRESLLMSGFYIMIGLGTAVINEFGWVLYLFAVFLVLTGLKMLIFAEQDTKSLEDNTVLQWLRTHLPITEQFHGNKFSVLLPHAENPGA